MPAACPCDKCRAAAIPTASTSTSLTHLEQLSGEELAAMASVLLEALGELQDLPPSSRLIASTLVQALHLASTFSSRGEGVSRVTDILGRTLRELGSQVDSSSRGWCDQHLRGIWRGSLRRDASHDGNPEHHEP